MGKKGARGIKCRWCHRRLILTPGNPIPEELRVGWFELVDFGLPVASPVFFCSNDCFQEYRLRGRDELAEYLNRHPPGAPYGWQVLPVYGGERIKALFPDTGGDDKEERGL